MRGPSQSLASSWHHSIHAKHVSNVTLPAGEGTCCASCTCLWPRRVSARGFAKERERGRRSAAKPVRTQGSLAAPAPVAAVPRVRSHRQRAHRSGSHSLRRASRVQDLERLRPESRKRRCRRASVRFVASPHSLDPRPRNPKRASFTSDAATVRRLPQPGTAPAPQKPLKLAASQVDRGEGSVGGRGAAGIRKHPRPRSLAKQTCPPSSSYVCTGPFPERIEGPGHRDWLARSVRYCRKKQRARCAHLQRRPTAAHILSLGSLSQHTDP